MVLYVIQLGFIIRVEATFSPTFYSLRKCRTQMIHFPYLTQWLAHNWCSKIFVGWIIWIVSSTNYMSSNYCLISPVLKSKYCFGEKQWKKLKNHSVISCPWIWRGNRILLLCRLLVNKGKGGEPSTWKVFMIIKDTLGWFVPNMTMKSNKEQKC